MTDQVPGYDLLKVVGEGANGVVYRARQRVVAAEVAVKVARSRAASKERRRTEKERMVMGALRGHPHVISIIDAGETASGHEWVAMELLEGGSLQDYINRQGTMDPARVAEIGATVGEALKAAHAVGVIHRDIKPANIMLSVDGTAKLADFGTVKLVDVSQTIPAMTVAYAPYEVVDGKPATEASDVYSLCLTLYELLTATHPFLRPEDTSEIQALARIATVSPEPLSSFGIGGSLAQTIDRGLARDPTERPTTTALIAGCRRAYTEFQPSGGLGINGVSGAVRIGAGARGTVYRARHRDSGAKVAVKVMHAPVRDVEAGRRFRDACAPLRDLGGIDGVVGVVEVGLTSSRHPFLIMDFQGGGTLADRMERQERFDLKEVADIGARLSHSLDAAHALGVVHLDLKPANVLLDGRGRPQIADFGLSAIVADTTATTAENATVGTPFYSAPEVLRGEPGTPASDVFSLGSLLYSLAAGEAAFAGGGGSLDIIHRVVHDEPPPLTDLGVPGKLARVIHRAMAKDPEQRPQTADLAQRLQLLNVRIVSRARTTAPEPKPHPTDDITARLTASGPADGVMPPLPLGEATDGDRSS